MLPSGSSTPSVAFNFSSQIILISFPASHSPFIKLEVIYVEEVAAGCPTSESVFKDSYVVYGGLNIFQFMPRLRLISAIIFHSLTKLLMKALSFLLMQYS